MEIVNLIIHNIFSFVAVISLIVFIHEFGHFWMARLCGVKIEEFAIGFGKEIFGFYDKKRTRWKFCLLPFGGYVKMYGDRNAASMCDEEFVKTLNNQQKKQLFVTKSVYQRMVIVAAGPLANFLLAIFLFTILFKINGIRVVEPVVGSVMEGRAAAIAGIKAQDRILRIDDKIIKEFDDLHFAVIESMGEKLQFEIERKIDDKLQILKIDVTPQMQTTKDAFGDEVKLPMIGIVTTDATHRNLNLWQAFTTANYETYKMSKMILITVKDLLIGKRDIKELQGPIKIAQYSSKSVKMGLTMLLWFMAIISINLGVMNILPLPVLDGGHLFFYFIELLFGKPLPQKVQQLGYSFGFAAVLSLMLFTTFNDVINLFR